MSGARVSVIMNCLNCSEYLRKAIDSVYNQTYQDWEIIFWDNASIDNSSKIAKSYDKKLRYFKGEKTIPLYAARNKALAQVRGEFIAFLDCDDLWMPKKLEKQIPLFNDPTVGIVFSDAIYFNQKGNTKRLYATMPYGTGWCFPALLSNYYLCLQTVIIRRAVLETQTEWFDSRFDIIGDADFFRRIAYKWKLAMVNETLAKWRVHSKAMTWTKPHLFYAETALMLKKYKETFPGFETKFAKQIRHLRRQVDIRMALALVRSGNGYEARNHLSRYVFSSIKVLGLFILTFLPKSFFHFASNLINTMEP